MTAHVVSDKAAPSTQLGMKCLHCDAKLALALPVAVEEMGSAVAAFDAKHRLCPAEVQGGANRGRCNVSVDHQTERCARCACRDRQLFHKGDGVWRCATCTQTLDNDFDAGAEPRGEGALLRRLCIGGLVLVGVPLALRGCA
jgi:hypothetical protein